MRLFSIGDLAKIRPLEMEAFQKIFAHNKQLLRITSWTFQLLKQTAFLLWKPFFQTMSWVLSLAAFYQLWSTFSTSGIVINGNIKCSQNLCKVRVTSFILSGTILKSLFCGILTTEIVMRKLALKNGMIPQKSEWLASLQPASEKPELFELSRVNAGYLLL